MKNPPPLPWPDVSHQEIYMQMSEHEHQRELMSWANRVTLTGHHLATLWASEHPQSLKRSQKLPPNAALHADSSLVWLHAIPNGGHRKPSEAARMRAEGVKAGVADLFLPKASGGLSGLYIELKRPNGKGKLSPAQRKFAEHVQNEGFAWHVAEGYWSAIKLILKYLEC